MMQILYLRAKSTINHFSFHRWWVNDQQCVLCFFLSLGSLPCSMVNGLYSYKYKALHNVNYVSHSHTLRLPCMCVPFTHTHTHSHVRPNGQKQTGVQYPAEGHFEWVKWSGARTCNPMVTKRHQLRHHSPWLFITFKGRIWLKSSHILVVQTHWLLLLDRRSSRLL